MFKADRPSTLPTAMALAGLLALSGCASLSEKECLNADWQRFGVRDGKDGQNRDRIDEHRKACAKVAVEPDETRWLQGWQEGIRQYCVPHKAWSLGLRGEYYRGACADQPGGDDFERYYDAGRRIYDIKTRMDRLYRDMQRLERELADAKNDEDRKKIRAQLRDLDFELRRLRNQQELEMLKAPR